MTDPEITTYTTRPSGAGRAMGWYLAIAAGAGLLDWVTKMLAVSYLTNNTQVVTDRLALMLVFNTGGAGGMSWGPYTWLINVCVTAVAVLMISLVVGPLAKVDRRAVLALGLVAGGATGNLISMVAGPAGVADFLAVRLSDSAVVANIADLALWSGALLLVPVVRSLLVAIRAERLAKVSRGMRLSEA